VPKETKSPLPWSPMKGASIGPTLPLVSIVLCAMSGDPPKTMMPVPELSRMRLSSMATVLWAPLSVIPAPLVAAIVLAATRTPNSGERLDTSTPPEPPDTALPVTWTAPPVPAIPMEVPWLFSKVLSRTTKTRPAKGSVVDGITGPANEDAENVNAPDAVTQQG